MSCLSFLDQFSDSELLASTGLSRSTFEYLYCKYCGSTTPINSPQNLLSLFKFYKHYPIRRFFHHFFGKKARSPNWFYSNRLKKWESHLASVINELDPVFDQRFLPHNHLPHVFSRNVTGSIDSFPICVVRPKSPAWQRQFYNGKYKAHVVKVQAMCDHSGNIIWYSGPHLGVTSDVRLSRTLFRLCQTISNSKWTISWSTYSWQSILI
jgi:hypothetical protein